MADMCMNHPEVVAYRKLPDGRLFCLNCFKKVLELAVRHGANVTDGQIASLQAKEVNMGTEAKCACGRIKGHSGRHFGYKPAKKAKEAKGAPIVAPVVKEAGAHRYASLLADLRSRRDGLNQAIETIEGLPV